MDYIWGILRLFAAFAPLYIGLITISSFLSYKKTFAIEKIDICRNRKMLATSIALLLVIPAVFIYTTLTHPIPDGDYSIDVEYTIAGGYEEWNSTEKKLEEIEIVVTGRGPLVVRVFNITDYEESPTEGIWGQTRSSISHYVEVYSKSIKLDYFSGNDFFIYDTELEENSKAEFLIEYAGHEYSLTIKTGPFTAENFGYTIEDRIADLSKSSIIEYSILMLLTIIGVAGFFMAEHLSKNTIPLDRLYGEDFLVAYFRRNGITEREIKLYRSWDGFYGCHNFTGDAEGLAYAAKRVQALKNYRKLSAEDVLRNIDNAPWAWPTAMHFEKSWGGAPRSNRDVCGVYLCSYGGKGYLFGIGKKEVPITEDMRKNGKWFVYTFAD